MTEPWHPGENEAERAARRAAYQRLADAARRVGLPADQLSGLLRNVMRNEAETRRFLSEEVYGVPDGLLDDLLRLRMEELDG
ncbi:MAG: hypothetical protein M3483_00140 [Gemmatimonadota bacterium]|nr:hypothetical protein [Gemmatimonadota bacterium]